MRPERRIIRKFLIWLAFILITLIIMSAGSVLVLPNLVSTDWVRLFVESHASKSLRRCVEIDGLQWKWSDGVRINGVRIKDDPSFSDAPMLFLSKAHIWLDFMELAHRRVVFNIVLQELNAMLIRSNDGTTNLDKIIQDYRKDYTEIQDDKKLPEKDMIPIALPLEVKGKIHVEDICFKAEDRAQSKTVTFKDARIDLDIPSLLHSPVKLKVSSDIDLDGSEIPPIALNMSAENLFGSEGRLSLDAVNINIDGVLPGIQADFAGNAGKRALKTEITADMAQIMEVMRPFLAPSISKYSVSGSLHFVANAAESSPNMVSFDMILEGSDLSLNDIIKPFGFKISNRGSADIITSSISIDSGGIRLFDKSRISWSGVFKNLTKHMPEIFVDLDPVYLDIGEMLQVFKSLVPQEISTGEMPPVLTIRHADFSSISTATGLNNLNVEGLTLTVPVIKIASTPFALDSKNINLSIEKLNVGTFPHHLDMKADISTTSLTLSGNQNIDIKGMEISGVRIFSDSIRLSEKAVFGIAAQFNLTESINIKELNISNIKELNISNLHMANLLHSISAECVLSETSNANIGISRIALSSPRTAIKLPDKASFETPLDFDITVPNIEILSLDPLKADIKGLKFRLSMGEMLNFRIEADTKNSGSDRLSTKGEITIQDYTKLYKIIKNYTSRQIPVLLKKGEMGIRWRFSGRIPKPDEIDRLSNLSSLNLKEDLKFLDDIDISCRVKDVSAELVQDKNRLRFSAMSTPVPIQYAFHRKTGKGKFNGTLAVGNIDELPQKGKIQPPLNIRLEFSGEHKNLESIALSQSLDIRPLNIKEQLNLSLLGMDQILSRDIKTPIPLWIRHMGGNIRFNAGLSKGAVLSLISKDLNMDGDISFGADIEIIPGQKLGIKIQSDMADLDVKYAENSPPPRPPQKGGRGVGGGYSIAGLNAQIRMEKDYRIDNAKPSNTKDIPAKMDGQPLSVSVMQEEPASAESENDSVRDLISRMQKRYNAQHTVSFKSAGLKTGALALDIGNFMLDFSMDKPLPRSDFFQIDIMGGTVIGSLIIFKKGETFFPQLQLAFSGLDTGKIIPETKDSMTGVGSELSGQISILLPLYTRMKPLLSDLQMDIRFSHIGSQALDYLLYALDPYESNETIISQRKLLNTGSPRWVRMGVKNGSISLTGEVSVKGVNIEIPKLERLNVAHLPGLEKFEMYLNVVKSVIEILKMFEAGILDISDDGSIRLLNDE